MGNHKIGPAKKNFRLDYRPHRGNYLTSPAPQPAPSRAMQFALAIEKPRDCFDSEFLKLVAQGGRAEQDRITRALKEKFSAKDFPVSSFNVQIKELRERTLHQANGEPGPLLSYTMTDDGNAQRLLSLYSDRLRYCPSFKSWLVWDGRRWKQDSAGQAQEMAVNTAREFLEQSEGRETVWKFAQRSLNIKQIIAALALAAPRVTVTSEQLDTAPYLLNFRNGTVDLRDGRIRKHDPADLITKLVDHNYVPAAQHPLWGEFIDWTMGGGPNASEADVERAARYSEYLQRSLGYSITGDTSEKAIFIPWGAHGNNGKTTMLVVIGRIIPEYSGMLDVETLMTRTRASSNASADIADLRGVRFVRTSEAESSQVLSQGLVKKLTEGQGDIKAIKKYENWSSFRATHKIWMDTNGRPRVSDIEDNAMMARMHLIPFPASLLDSEVDRDLPNRMVTQEAEGILAWLVDGAGKWYRNRLLRPAEFIAARDQWRDEMEIEDPWTVAIRDWVKEQEDAFENTSRHFSGEEFTFSIKDLLTSALKIPIDRQDDKGAVHSARAGKIVARFTESDGSPSWDRFRTGRPNREWLYRRPKGKK